MSISTMIAATLVAATTPLATPTPVAASVATSATAATTRTVGPDTRICVVNHRVGSIAATKICRRYARWLSDGIDPMTARRIR